MFQRAEVLRTACHIRSYAVYEHSPRSSNVWPCPRLGLMFLRAATNFNLGAPEEAKCAMHDGRLFSEQV
jgi:hypothetical protein